MRFKFSLGCFLLFFLLLVVFAGCDELKGVQKVQEKEINQSKIESFLVDDTVLQEQNISVTQSIVQALQNLERLNKELESLNGDIDNITQDLKKIQDNSSLDSETVKYLNYINELVGTSNRFVYELQTSTIVWSNYLNRMSQNSSSLNFSDEESAKEIAKSITNPIEVFE